MRQITMKVHLGNRCNRGPPLYGCINTITTDDADRQPGFVLMSFINSIRLPYLPYL